MNKENLEKNFDELKDIRFRDSTNVIRVQIDLFLNMLQEIDAELNKPGKNVRFKSSYFGSDKTLTEAGRDLIFSILDNIDFEWERLIVKLLINVDKDNQRKFQMLEDDLLKKFEGLSRELYTSQYNAGIQMDRLLEQLMTRVEEAKHHRRHLLHSLRELVEQDMKRLTSSSEKKVKPPLSFEKD